MKKHNPVGWQWLVVAAMLAGIPGSTVGGDTGQNLHYLVVDASGSIRKNRMIKPIVEAVKRHVNRLGAEDEVRVAIFNEKVRFQSTWPAMTFDAKTDFGRRFARKYEPGGETYLYDTVASVLAEVERDAGGYDLIKVLILSDGNDSKKGGIRSWDPIVEEACTLVRSHPSSLITFYPIGFEDAILPEDCIEVTYIDDRAVEIPPDPPRADFEAAPLAAQTGEEVTFFARRSPGEIETLTWSFGDGAETAGPLDSHEIVRHVYTEPGLKTVSLTAVGIGGEDLQVRKDYITVAPVVPLEAAFSWTPEAPRVGEDLVLVNESTGNPESLTWSVQGKGAVTGAAPRVPLEQAGELSVSLEIRRGETRDTVTRTLTVLPPLPRAGIAISPTGGIQVGDAVRLAASPVEEGVRYRWMVGGEAAGEGAGLDWVAVTPGPVEVVLAADGPGGRTTARERFFVQELPPPDAGFTIEPAGEADLGAEIRLRADVRGDGLRHRWRIGDAVVLEGPEVAWTADRVGALVVVHEVEGPGGTGSGQDRLLIRDLPVPDADFTIEPKEVEVGAEVTVRAMETGPGLVHAWRMGTTTHEGPEVRFTASDAGTVTVVHEVSSRGKTGRMERAFTAVEPVLLTPAFSASSRKGTRPLTVSFADKTRGVVTSYAWDFGDGSPVATVKNPEHTYTRSGTYLVRLTVGNQYGQTTTSVEPLAVTVKEPLPGWVWPAVGGGLVLLAGLLAYLKLRPVPPGGTVQWEQPDGARSAPVEVTGTSFDLTSLTIPDWNPEGRYVIAVKGGRRVVLHDGMEHAELGRDARFRIDGVTFKYLNQMLDE